MPGLNIFTSNRLEILAAQLAQHLKAPASEPLLRDIIVIQSIGMERWISQELAGHNGICANIDFPFPNTFLDRIANQILPADDAQSPFDRDILLFEILKLLPECIHIPGFERLGSYLRDDPTRLKELQIASKLADLYDQYQVFRPEMIFRWEKGQKPEYGEDCWQIDLWQQLLSVRPNLDRSSRQRNLIEKLETVPEIFADLPQRIFMFGISYLPLFHVETFAALSQVVETNVYLLNPCREYWGDILSQKQIQRIRRIYSYSADATSELHLEEGNRLLASMGAQGKDFHTTISNFELQMHEDYADPGCTNLLSCIQSDILNLRDRRPQYFSEGNHMQHPIASSPEPVFAVSPSDTSIQIHSCHSPMREIEILHDSLLAMFDADPHVLPKDIVVMTPDIETYAPIIQAVFGAQIEKRHHIPFNLADRGIRGQGGLIDDFFSFLDLKGTRFSVTRILHLLEVHGVRRKYDIQPGDIDIIERWIDDTRIRWGIDAEHRRRLGLPALSENTWCGSSFWVMPCREIMSACLTELCPMMQSKAKKPIVLGNF